MILRSLGVAAGAALLFVIPVHGANAVSNQSHNATSAYLTPNNAPQGYGAYRYRKLAMAKQCVDKFGAPVKNGQRCRRP